MSVINLFYGIRKCNLERCHVRLFLEGLEMYSKNLRKSNHHVKKDFVWISGKYQEGFKDCVALARNRYFLMLPISSSCNSKSNGRKCSTNWKGYRRIIFIKKIYELTKLADFYHVKRCENIDCSNCLFIINLRYLYVQNTVVEDDSVLSL